MAVVNMKIAKKIRKNSNCLTRTSSGKRTAKRALVCRTSWRFQQSVGGGQRASGVRLAVGRVWPFTQKILNRKQLANGGFYNKMSQEDFEADVQELFAARSSSKALFRNSSTKTAASRRARSGQDSTFARWRARFRAESMAGIYKFQIFLSYDLGTVHKYLC